MPIVYIARQFTSESEYDYKTYYKEKVFTSFSDAELFVKQHFIEESENFVNEIVSHQIGLTNSNEDTDTWYFNNRGVLLHTTSLSEADIKKYNDAYNTYTSKFSVGDFVLIKSFPKNKYNNMWTDILGFVAQCPVCLNKWILDGNNKEEWDSCYVIYFINSKGSLDHIHVPEVAMQAYELPVPDELYFLKIYSDVIRNNISINAEYNDAIWEGRIIVKKINIFDINKLFAK